MDSFRGHGLKIEYTASGPFWAVRDGALMLKPFRLLASAYFGYVQQVSLRLESTCVLSTDYRRSIVPVAHGDIVEHGDYIIAFNSHFIGLRARADGLKVNETNRTHLWQDARLSDASPSPLTRCRETRKMLLNMKHVDGVFKIQVAEDDTGRSSESDLRGGSGMPRANCTLRRCMCL